jgi:hypothetical protein
LLIQSMACASGLAGVYFANDAKYQWLLALLIVLASFAVIFAAWNERQSREFVERALESLILSSKPNDHGRNRVISAINHAAGEQKFPQTQTIGFSDGSMKVRFFNVDQAALGSIVVDDEAISRMAILPDVEIASAAKAIFKPRTTKTERSRDQLVRDISLAGQRFLWEKNVKTPEWCNWVNDELISIPTSPPDQTCPNGDRVTFDADKFQKLMRSSDFELFTLVEEHMRKKMEN